MCRLNYTQPHRLSLNPASFRTLELRHFYYLLLTATILDLCVIQSDNEINRGVQVLAEACRPVPLCSDEA